MADGVHAPVQAHEATPQDAVLDRPGPEPAGPQLAGRDDAVLPRGERRDRLVAASGKKSLTVRDFLTHALQGAAAAEDRGSLWHIRRTFSFGAAVSA